MPEVSSATQNLDRQVKLFKEMEAYDRNIFIEKNRIKALKIEKSGNYFMIDLGLEVLLL